ncbi:MAG: peptidoglycan editing factor PgeF [Deltaproteobacteria bacterium]|nr:peptidoglycan editing factor PgeF [Deltaproteobacteria bacterium]
MAVQEPIKLHRSPVIPSAGFVHGFPERTGGVSSGLRSSLNLGMRWGDDQANVDTNRRLLAEHAGYDPAQLVATRHVHGTNVWRVGEPLAEGAEFDGLVSDRVGPVLGAFAADCIPMVFAEAEARVCGAAHAGWRGAVAGIATNVITRMVELGARPERIRVALGPSIGPCCFEVGREVVDEFRAVLGELPGLIVEGPNKNHIDLRVASRTFLERAGVRAEQIDDRPPCTKCEGDRFFSYRRDGREGGVHMGFIGLT